MPGRTGYFLVSKQAVTGEVASGMLRPYTSLPPASSQVQLMCYEFGPYAAALRSVSRLLRGRSDAHRYGCRRVLDTHARQHEDHAW